MYMLLDPTYSHSSALEILSHNIQDAKVTTSDCKEDFLRLTKTQTPRANVPVSLKQGLQIQLSEIIHVAALLRERTGSSQTRIIASKSLRLFW